MASLLDHTAGSSLSLLLMVWNNGVPIIFAQQFFQNSGAFMITSSS